MRGIFSTATAIGFFIMGLVQVTAAYAFLVDYWSWPTLLAAPVCLVFAYIPFIGSICGFLGALYAWNWEWWHAVILFFWWPLLVIMFWVLGIGTNFYSRMPGVKKAGVAILLVGIIGGGVWWLQNNKTDQDWWTVKLRSTSKEYFAKDFINSFQKSPVWVQADLTFAMHEIFFIEKMRLTGKDPFPEVEDEISITYFTINLLYKKAKTDKSFTISSIVSLSRSMKEQFPEYAHEFKNKYAEPIREILDERLAAMGAQKRDEQILMQIESMKKMAEDLVQ